MKKTHALPALLLVASLSVHAMPGEAEAGGHFRNRMESPRAELFAEFKAIESYSHKERIRILQEAEACIQAAADRDAYRACEEREGQARDQVKTQVKARHEAMRTKIDGLRESRMSRR